MKDFNYTYSAPTEEERKEIESIKKQYQKTTEKKCGKLEELRRLNKKVTRPPVCLAWTLGIFGTLVTGLGMTMVLEWDLLIQGIFVGIAGIAAAALAYPIYKKTLTARKRKYSAEIVALSDKLLNNGAEEN